MEATDKNIDLQESENNELEADESEKHEADENCDCQSKYKYEAPWPIYGLDWSMNPVVKFRLALSSFIEKSRNELKIISLNEDNSSFKVDYSIDHLFPATKVMWIPDYVGIHPHLVATTSDNLRVWQIKENGPKLELLLRSNEHHDCLPMTSFDWSSSDRNLIATSNNDSNCTIFAIETKQILSRINTVKASLRHRFRAHNGAVYDVAFNHRERNLLASVGADKTINIFDLRDLVDSTVVYKSLESNDLVRIAWNKWDSKYLSIIELGSNEVKILDCRAPVKPVKILNHSSPVNGMCWAPYSINHLSTAGDDCKAIIWDTLEDDYFLAEPIVTYTVPMEIDQILWSTDQPDHIAICFQKTLEIIKV